MFANGRSTSSDLCETLDTTVPRMVVTGAFSYTGKYITRRLVAKGHRVLTLTNHPERENPFGDRVIARAYHFQDPGSLADSLRGATTLFNTYWVRFPHGAVTYGQAIDNTQTLLDAAKAAGVQRIVHVSIANPHPNSPLPYYHGKAAVEQAVIGSGISYAILRPTVIFGDEDILINNIAYLVRRWPIFLVPGRGTYRIQPIFVEDMAELALAVAGTKDSLVMDAVGPEVYTFDEIVERIAGLLGRRVRLLHVPPWLALQAASLLGWMVGDVLLTRQEMHGLMADLLVSSGPPTGWTRLSDWLAENASRVGTHYASELARHYARDLRAIVRTGGR